MLKVFWEKYFRDRQEPTYTKPGKLAFTHALAEHITKWEIVLNEKRESLAKNISEKKSQFLLIKRRASRTSNFLTFTFRTDCCFKHTKAKPTCFKLFKIYRTDNLVFYFCLLTLLLLPVNIL